MFVRKSLLLASIAAVGVSVAFAQQAGVTSHAAPASASQSIDPFAAPPPASGSWSGTSPNAAAKVVTQADVEALAFGSPAAGEFAAAPAAPMATQTLGLSPAALAVPGALPQVAAQPVPAAVPDGFGSVPAAGSAGFQIGAPTPVAMAAPLANPFTTPVGQATPTMGSAPATAGAAAFTIEAPAAGKAAPDSRSATDETALRYYASQRDLVRVGAEIRRLKTLYPNWQAPSDLFAPRGGAEEQPLWDIYAKGDYAGLRRAIAAIKVAKPNWTPSADLTSKLDDGEARQAVNSALASGNWTGAIATAQKRPQLLVCSNMDVLWAVGESFARSGNLARAFDLYSYVLSNCDVPSERLATFQKANDLLPAQGVEALASYGRVLATGQREFDGLRFDRLRKQMADVASGASSQTPPVEELKAYADYVRSSRSTNDMGLVGWYFYGQENWERAAEWFRAGMDAGGDAKLVEGYVLSLRNADRIVDAEAVANAGYSRSPELAKIYVEMISDELTVDDFGKTIDEGVLKRFKSTVKDLRSPLGAQAIGWRLIHEEEFEEAKEWFGQSVEWKPSEEAVVGLALVATRLKNKADLKALRARYEDAFPVLADFKDYTPNASPGRRVRQAAAAAPRGNAQRAKSRGRSGGGDTLMAEANLHYESGDYQGALDALDRREARRGKEYGAEILRGWANHKLKRWETARQVFTAQDRKRSTKDTRFGIGATSNSQYRMWSDSKNNCTQWGRC